MNETWVTWHFPRVWVTVPAPMAEADVSGYFMLMYFVRPAQPLLVVFIILINDLSNLAIDVTCKL